MTVKEFAEKLDLELLTGEIGTDKEVKGMYAGDLLSWVMSKAEKGDAWVTVLTNLNVIAVALMTEVSCVIIPESIKVDDQTLKRAIREGIAILSTEKDTFEVCVRSGKILGY